MSCAIEITMREMALLFSSVRPIILAAVWNSTLGLVE